MLSKIRSAPVPLGSQAVLSELAMMFLAFSLLTATSLWGRETPEEFLKRNGIGPTKEGLIAALYNPDWTIRLNAGERIVTDREMTAVPELVAAAEREKIPALRFQFYYMMARLGEKSGLSSLVAACSNTRLAPATRLTAAQFLAGLDPNACLPEVTTILDSHVSAVEADFAMKILANLKFAKSPVSPTTRDRVLKILVHRLGDPEPAVRSAASTALIAIGGESEIATVKTAAAGETDESTRQSMKRDLEAVQNRPQ